MKNGDIVEFKNYGKGGRNYVNTSYDFGMSEKIARATGVSVAAVLTAKENKGKIILQEHASATLIPVEYIQENGRPGFLCFEKADLIVVKPYDPVINDYQIY